MYIIRADRFQLEWILAAERQKFAKVMRAMEDKLKAVTKEEIEYTMRVLS